MHTTKEYYFKKALLPSGWTDRVKVSLSDSGDILEVSTEVENHQGSPFLGSAIPGIPNIHSHAFQRAMAGLTEYQVTAQDNFWTWRESMYRFVNKISPEDLYHIASQVYLEMLQAGYTSVAEFHYLHHQETGCEYSKIEEMSSALLDAANNVGLGITLLPVLYMTSDFGGKALSKEQRRFKNATDSYLSIFNNISHKCSAQNAQYAGAAIHSLRAVPPEAMSEVLCELEHVMPKAPIHIHIAEQMREVEDCIKWCEMRPTEWLLNNYKLDDHWCLVHATHLTAVEISGVANSGATIGLCPTTEANLGDGLFPLSKYLEAGGKIAIGSDSNISVSPIEELRWLEYGQRLVHQQRNIGASSGQKHTGTRLTQLCLEGGRSALGQPIGRIEAGCRADILVLDDQSPILAQTPSDYLLDSLIFSGNQTSIKEVLVAGKLKIADYTHINAGAINNNFIRTLKKLRY